MGTGPFTGTIGGRYVLSGEIASGGMATVHLARQIGAAGFGRIVAIKRLHERFARDPDFVAMFLDEAHIVARIRHPNVVQTVDVVAEDGELFLVLEYVHGESLLHLVRAATRAGRTLPIPVACGIVAGALRGLHEAHEARSETGEPLGIVHRDVSPHNVLVGVDGVARVLDFGVAKAGQRIQTTEAGQLKGKLSYMAPEQVTNQPVDRRTDVYAAGVVLWETLTGAKLFQGASEGAVLNQLLLDPHRPPSERNRAVTPELDAVVMKALSRDPNERWPTAREMAAAIERATALASPSEIGEEVAALCESRVSWRSQLIAAIEARASSSSRQEAVDSLRTLAQRRTDSSASMPSHRAPSGPVQTVPPPAWTPSNMPLARGASVHPGSDPGTPDPLSRNAGPPGPPSSKRGNGAVIASVAIAAALIVAALGTAVFFLVVRGRASAKDASSRGAAASASAAGAAGAGAAGAGAADAKTIVADGGDLAALAGSAGGSTAAPSGAAAASGNVASCPEGMAFVPGGRFFMGSDDDLAAEKPAHKVTVRGFCMDMREVTTAAYRACSDRGDCKRAGTTNKWEGITPKDGKIYDPLCNATDASRGQHPINCVDWMMADRFCKAEGKRLPTEAEWEYAARGSDGRKFPWGDEAPTPKHLNACGAECVLWGKKHGAPLDGMFAESDAWPTTAPVGSFPAGASRWGIEDIVGNVWEWVSDFYAPYTDADVEDPTGPASGATRVMRGGAWNGAYPDWVRPSFRFHSTPDTRSHGVGFRCAKTP